VACAVALQEQSLLFRLELEPECVVVVWLASQKGLGNPQQ